MADIGKQRMNNNRLLINADEMVAIAELMFDQGKSVIMAVPDNSMYPFLRHQVDKVEIFRVSTKEISVSDIVLIKIDKDYRLHRVCKIGTEDYFAIADASATSEGPYKISSIIGRVSAIYRKEKCIPCSSAVMCCCVFLWRMLRRFRPLIIKTYLKFRLRSIKNEQIKRERVKDN